MFANERKKKRFNEKSFISRIKSRVRKAETAAGSCKPTGSVELDFEKKLILFIDCFLRFQSTRLDIK